MHLNNIKVISWVSSLLLSSIVSSSILPREANSSTNFTTTHFGLIAIRSGSPIHLSPVNASGFAFWIGKDTTTFCPLTNTTLCPPGNLTSLVTSPGATTLGMDTEVPGGQAVYVAPNGALSYTIPHSAYIPPGSSYESFNAVVPTNNTSFGRLTYNGTDSFTACPSSRNSTEGPYQVFVDVGGLTDEDVPGGCVDECIGFLAKTARGLGDSAAAWQYE